jgi:hypothetical protein
MADFPTQVHLGTVDHGDTYEFERSQIALRLTSSLSDNQRQALLNEFELIPIEDLFIEADGDSNGVAQAITLNLADARSVAQETERWDRLANVLGLAVEGPLEGYRLEQLVSGSHFWFAWSVFKPESRVIR